MGNYYGICKDYHLKWISSLKEFDLVIWMLLNILPAGKQEEEDNN